MKYRLPALSAILLCSTLSACSFSSPPRPEYSGADYVGAVEPDMLIGTWDYKVLNPVEGEPAADVVMTFNPDGTIVSVTDLPAQEGVPMSAMTLQVSGTWKVDGEYVITTTEDVQETSGNKLGGMMASMGKGYAAGLEGKIDVFEANSSRLVVVSESDGERIAGELSRQ